jgi:predicted amidohydrolase
VIIVRLEQTAPVPGLLEQNTNGILFRAKAALHDGNQIVVFPELAVSGYVTEPEVVAASAQPLDGPLVSALTGLTHSYGGLVAAGYV